MGISDQSSKWWETLALKDHYGFTIGFCLTPVLSIAIVTLTVQDTPLENPRKKKHSLWGWEIKIFIQEKDSKAPNSWNFTEFLFRLGLFSGRSQAGFVKRASPQSRAWMHPKCLEAEHFFSRQLLLSWNHLCQGLSKSALSKPCFPWASASPPSSRAAGRGDWGTAQRPWG